MSSMKQHFSFELTFQKLIFYIIQNYILYVCIVTFFCYLFFLSLK